MKKLILLLLVALSMSIAVFAQTNTTQKDSSTTTETKKRPPIFRATKDQITQVQKMLKVTETGKMDDAFRDEIKKYQSSNGLKATGTLNRATLEKMNVELTDKQKEIPVNPNSFASTDDSKTTKSKTPRKAPFRANKEQIMAVQKMLKEKSMYAGEETGKLDDATRDGLKKFQEANNIKVTGTLNKETLEKTGVPLTDKQKEM
ncbi:MAG: peptidoglycan-binding domain-containing protein [Pyrinomonadaceae bacterium]